MTHTDRSIVSQDNRDSSDFNDVVLTAEPFSQAEIDDLLYSDGFSRSERLERLRALRDDLAGREASDLGNNDTSALLGEVREAIGALETEGGESMDASSVDHNPEDHSETMSPDSDEYIDRMAAEEASLAEPDTFKQSALDDAEWDDGDGFDPSKGVG